MTKKNAGRNYNLVLRYPATCAKCERQMYPKWKAFRKKKGDIWVTWCVPCRVHELRGKSTPAKRPAAGRRARFVTGRP